MHARTLRHSQEGIAIVVTLYDGTLLDANALGRHAAQTVNNGSLQLVLQSRQINHLTHIGCDPDIMNRNTFAFDADFSDFGYVAGVA